MSLEQMKVIGTALKPPVTGPTLGRTAWLPETHSITEYVAGCMNQFHVQPNISHCHPPVLAIQSYIQNNQNKIEKGRFFGTD